MRNLKKFLALVLAMMMAVSLVVTGSAAKWDSAAGTFNDSSDVVDAFEEGVAVVTGMKIFKGDAGTKDFRPAANIKRSEVAAIVYRLVTGDVGDDSAYLYTHVAPFTDVNPDDWFAGYVGYLWNAEIIKGSNTERTQFNPYGEVTGYEALAMVLRAMGYDENDEFTGSGWQIRVGQTANTTGLLTNVNTTNYGAGHLNAAARRDTVAEIIFQAAITPTVVYTPAFGYQTTNVTNGSDINASSLGLANFGLVWDRGVVVGNQSTGETTTKMTFVAGQANDIYSARKVIDSTSYIYGGVYDDDDTDSVIDSGEDVSVTRNFDHVTDLNDFGHAQKIWYNRNTNHTYAWFDEATKDLTVYTRYDVDDSDLTNDGNYLVLVAKQEGFTVSTDSVSGNVLAFASNKYDRMGPLAMDNDYGFGTNYKYRVATSTALDEKQDAVESPIHMYKLVSNSGTKLDVIVSLDAEVAQILDTNTTNTSERIVLREATLGGDNMRNSTQKGEIQADHLTPDSVKTLGINVEAWVVDGTTKIDGATGDPNRDINSWYRTLAVKNGPSGLVRTVDSEDTVTLADGQQVKKSYLYDVVKGGCIYQPDAITAGVNLTFVVDQWGRYLGVTSDPGYSFIYGTFADHSYGAVGSGELSYLVYGVDANGGKIVDHPLTQLQHNNTDAAFLPMNGEQFNDIEVARRDYGNTTNGNQVARGVYRGGVITADGRWWVNDDDTTGNGVPGYYSIADKSGDNWIITSGDATRGFLDVSAEKDGRLLVTNNTVFYVVSGTGTATLNVKQYTGMTQFLENATQAIIDVGYKDVSTDDNSYDVAYMTNVDTYHSVISDRGNNNRMVTKVFLYEDAVERNSTTTLYYMHDNSVTGLKIARNSTEYYEYEQYELWQGSTKTNVFLDTSNGVVPAADTFYALRKVGAPNGIDVYELVEGPGEATYNTGTYLENEHIDYFATNDTSTARIGGKGVLDTIYGVKDATVVDLTKLSSMHSDTGCLADGAHSAHNEIKSVNDLFYAISVGYDVDVSIQNTGSNVTLIYVVHVNNAPIYGG